MKLVAQLLKTKPSATVYQVSPSASVREALVMMAEGGVGAVLVTEGKAIVGIFTERDYARKVVLYGRTSENTSVRDVMTSNVMYVRPDQNNEECMAIMTQNRVRHLPVVENGQLIGILSIGDLVKDIISEQQFTIDQLENYIMGGGGVMIGKPPARFS